MTSTTAADLYEAEPWAPQHWSREEWFYMWTKGLDPVRIAVLCRVPYRKVYDHIRTRITFHPELFGQRLMVHDQPALPPGGLRKPKPTWDERCAELVEFRRAHGRFPRGYIEGEVALYSFLQNQRRRYRAGDLPDSRKTSLDEQVPGWLTPPKAEREHALWQQRVRELGTFLRLHGRYPRYTGATPATRERRILRRRCWPCGWNASGTASAQENWGSPGKDSWMQLHRTGQRPDVVRGIRCAPCGHVTSDSECPAPAAEQWNNPPHMTMACRIFTGGKSRKGAPNARSSKSASSSVRQPPNY